MIKGLYTSGVGMITQQKRMDVLTNNLANADTTGFKRDIAVTRSFPEELAKRLDDPTVVKPFAHANRVGDITYGSQINLVHTDFAQGGYKRTDGLFDMTIEGSGFFGVNVYDKDGKATLQYTRDGSFALDNNRVLMTKEGNRVQGQNGDIVIPDGELSFGSRGEIYVDGALVDQMILVDVENKESLRKVGDNYYTVTDETKMTAFSGALLHGYLESSNVNIVKEMVEMITINRAYEINSKAIQTHDTTMQRAANDLAKR